MQNIGRLIAEIDALLSAQVNQILRDPKFRQLESAWRGLKYLISSGDQYLSDEYTIRVLILNVGWRELSNDLQAAIEFDQSDMFRKVYSNGFDVAGGEPFGLLIGNYEVGRSNDDIATLRAMSQVSAAAFAPFVASAHPSLLGLTSFVQLERGINLTAVFEQPDYIRWREFRDEEDSRFVGLTLPRILLREPYRQESYLGHGFIFNEDPTTSGAQDRLWGSASWAFGAAVIRSFATSGWLTDIRGLRRGEDGGGRIFPPIPEWMPTDSRGLIARIFTEVVITDDADREMSELGLIPLCHCQDTPFAAFYGNRSVQKPPRMETALATGNAKISAMLQYILCAGRFAHYLKILARNKFGSLTDARALEDELSKWVRAYVVEDEMTSAATKAQFPLRGAEVEVRAVGGTGTFACFMKLWPHSQMDELVGSLRLTTEMNATPVR